MDVWGEKRTKRCEPRLAQSSSSIRGKMKIIPFGPSSSASSFDRMQLPIAIRTKSAFISLNFLCQCARSIDVSRLCGGRICFKFSIQMILTNKLRYKCVCNCLSFVFSHLARSHHYHRWTVRTRRTLFFISIASALGLSSTRYDARSKWYLESVCSHTRPPHKPFAQFAFVALAIGSLFALRIGAADIVATTQCPLCDDYDNIFSLNCHSFPPFGPAHTAIS